MLDAVTLHGCVKVSSSTLIDRFCKRMKMNAAEGMVRQIDAKIAFAKHVKACMIVSKPN